MTIVFFVGMTNATAMQGSILENVRWKALGVLFTVWVLILASEIAKVGRYEISNSNPEFPFCFSSYVE